MAARTRPPRSRSPSDNGPIDFRHLHKAHMEANAREVALRAEARALRARGKVEAADGKDSEANQIRAALTRFEVEVRASSPYERKGPMRAPRR